MARYGKEGWMPNLNRRTAAEFIRTALLVAAVIGSGIMGERLAGGNVAIALLANTLATGTALIVLILTFGGVSGAHLNPAVTLADAVEGGIRWREVPAYIAAQCMGGIAGTALAHAMFGLQLFSQSQHVRSGPSQVLSEFMATFGLLSVIWGCSRLRQESVPFAVGAYITAAYLVYSFNVICQSCSYGCAHIDEYIFRGAPSRCARIHRCAIIRRNGCNSVF
jgi:glycerol uptake facilitator-like aquaporin